MENLQKLCEETEVDIDPSNHIILINPQKHKEVLKKISEEK